MKLSQIETYHNNSDLLKHYQEYKKTNVSSNIMSKYERTTIIGMRATQFENGAQPLCEIPKDTDNVVDIAKKELEERKTPFIVKRDLDSHVDYWKIEDMIIHFD